MTVKTGFVPANSENLLVLADEAQKKSYPLTTDNISSLVFFVRERFEVNFTYPFSFNPIPYSDELLEEVSGLHNTGYLRVGSPIAVASKGRTWLDTNAGNVRDSTLKISRAMARVSGWDNAMLFRASYLTAADVSLT